MVEEAKKMTEAGGWTRKVLATYEGVRVKVPSVDAENDNMKLMPGFVDADGKKVSSRWQYGMIVKPPVWLSGRLAERAVICNRNFYDIDSDDLGRKITARVEIIKKSRGNQVFVMIDITKTETAVTISDLRISRDGQGILIPGTKFWISVVPRKFPEKIAKAA